MSGGIFCSMTRLFRDEFSQQITCADRAEFSGIGGYFYVISEYEVRAFWYVPVHEVQSEQLYFARGKTVCFARRVLQCRIVHDQLISVESNAIRGSGTYDFYQWQSLTAVAIGNDISFSG